MQAQSLRNMPTAKQSHQNNNSDSVERAAADNEKMNGDKEKAKLKLNEITTGIQFARTFLITGCVKCVDIM